MKRIAFILLLASVAGAEGRYVVMHGTTSAARIMVENLDAKEDIRIPCANDQETCSDLAEALNAAHERRIKPCNRDVFWDESKRDQGPILIPPCAK